MAGLAESSNFVTLYSSKAHVFEINPQTKNTWLPKADSAISISFVATIVAGDGQYNNERSGRELKLIAVDNGGERVLDALISTKTVFTKRAQKFGQFVDPTGTLYGIGFNSEADLTEFIETFQQLQRDILVQSTYQLSNQQNISVAPANVQQTEPRTCDSVDRNFNGFVPSETNGRNQQTAIKSSPPNNVSSLGASVVQHESGQDLKSPNYQQRRPQRPPPQVNGEIRLAGSANDSNNNPVHAYQRGHNIPNLPSRPGPGSGVTSGKGSPEDNSLSTSQADWQLREQLRYENERLKQALEESSKNAGMWHNELLNLRTNNVKLTQALHDSKAHVAQWESQLANLREENKELRVQIQNIESDGGKGLQRYVEDMQGELRRKDEEIDELQRSMDNMELKVRSVDATRSSDGGRLVSGQKFDTLSAKLQAKIDELAKVQSDLAQIVQELHS